MTVSAASRSEWPKPAFLALSCVGFVSSAHAAADVATGTALGEAGAAGVAAGNDVIITCLLYTSPSPRD